MSSLEAVWFCKVWRRAKWCAVFFIAPERERKHSGKGRVWRTAAVTENK